MRSMDKAFKARGYVLQGMLGEGAFAKVLLCKNIKDKKLYAAKVMNFEGNRRLKWEAENEIEIMKDLRRHPYIASLSEVIRDSESTTLILEYISSTPYLHGIQIWSNYTEADAQTSMKQLLKAINYCHKHKIMHRDISPSNILWIQQPTFSKPDASPWLKLIDFNLARRISDGKAVVECDPLGTDLYMSPEALKDRSQVGLASDIWSLGVLLFFSLVGYPPFWCDNYQHLLKNIDEGCYSMPKRYWSSIPSEAHDLVKEMLQVKPSLRIAASDALKHPRCSENLTDEAKDKSNLSIVQSRIIVYINKTKPFIREASNPDRTFPKPSARIPYVPDKDFDKLTFQIVANNNV